MGEVWGRSEEAMADNVVRRWTEKWEECSMELPRYLFPFQVILIDT